MRHHEIIHLISVTFTEDELGNQIEELTEREIFANEHTVSKNDSIHDYRNDAMTGLRQLRSFEIYSFEYNGEERLRHGMVTFRIVRITPIGEKAIIVCEKVAADV